MIALSHSQFLHPMISIFDIKFIEAKANEHQGLGRIPSFIRSGMQSHYHWEPLYNAVKSQYGLLSNL